MADEWNKIMNFWWNDTDRRNPKYAEKNLSQEQFVDHKPHVDWLASNLGLRGERPDKNDR